jgi:hypothetical protein
MSDDLAKTSDDKHAVVRGVMIVLALVMVAGAVWISIGLAKVTYAALVQLMTAAMFAAYAANPARMMAPLKGPHPLRNRWEFLFMLLAGVLALAAAVTGWPA